MTDQEVAFRERQTAMGCTCFPVCVRRPPGAPVFVHDADCALFAECRRQRERIRAARFN